MDTSDSETHMPVIRNQLASGAAGGPRQFAELRDIILVSTQSGQQGRVRDRLSEVGFEPKALNSTDVIVAHPETTIERVLGNVQSSLNRADRAIQEIQDARESEQGFLESTAATIQATTDLLESIADIPDVISADFGHSFADFGPANLRKNPFQLPTVSTPEAENDTLRDVTQMLNMGDAWATTKGENATVAIFDTAYSEDLIAKERIVGTFSADDVDSVYESSEGHGTMCAGAAAADKEKENTPFNGTAPKSDVILVRTTGPDGQIRSDVIAEAWDWINDMSSDRPIVTNHSYGTPLCSRLRRPEFCNDPLSKVITEINSQAHITSCYAAGNEAMYCGHRLSGLTNGITAHNSLEELITVGALLSNGKDAQRYSSHGRGDCAPRADPKPNVSFRIPMKTYYGGEDGFKIKDMSTGVYGSSGGTSHASPLTCGAVALLQSRSMDVNGEPLETETIKNIIKDNSAPPRKTQVNSFGFLAGPEGWDARFGYGQFQVNEALSAV